ncbi:hypothetical protein [Aliikangiella sp. IMCC44632]
MKQTTPCCPDLVTGKQCDYVDFIYRLTHYTDVKQDNREQRVAVEVAIHVRAERCTGPLQLGNLVYSTSLLPGEKVRLFTQNRKTRWSYDAESQLSYRHEQSAEEQYYMESFEKLMSDLESRESINDDSSSSGSASSSAGTSSPLETVFLGGSVSVEGSFNAQSSRDFLRELNVHAESSHNRSVQMTRSTNAVQIGEVQTRQHAEGESESHLESSSRSFENKNECHSVTYLFYQLDKVQTTKFKIRAVKTRVIDPVANTSIVNRPVVADSKLSVIPTAVLATSNQVEKMSARKAAFNMTAQPSHTRSLLSLSNLRLNAQPLADSVKSQALSNIQNDLVKSKILTKEGGITKELEAEFNFEFSTSIPTSGVIVKGCLDDCNTCEDARGAMIQLKIERQKLENQLLKKKIELLESSQEYRCCPKAEEEVLVEES